MARTEGTGEGGALRQAYHLQVFEVYWDIIIPCPVAHVLPLEDCEAWAAQEDHLGSRCSPDQVRHPVGHRRTATIITPFKFELQHCSSCGSRLHCCQ
eukprot:COSAG06_NODE_3022_length_5949_cov_8.542051_4_plen_97_part_00